MKSKNMKKSRRNDNIFEKVHNFLRKGKFSEVISILIDQCKGGLNRNFKENKNHAWYCAGCAYFEIGNFNAAKKAFLNAYRNNVDDIQCLIAYGNCLSELKKPKFAEKILKKALLKRPKGKEKATIIYNLGNAFFDQELYDSAIAEYSVLIKRRDKIGNHSRKNNALAHRLLRENNTGLT